MYKEFELNLKKKMFRGYGKWTKWRACGYLSINPKAETHEKNCKKKKNVYEKERRENYRSCIIIIALGWVGGEAGTRDFFFVSVYGYNRYNKLIRLDTTRISSSFMCVFFFLIIIIIIFIFFEFKQTKNVFFLFFFFIFLFCFSQTIYVIRRWIMNRYSNLGGMSLISFSWTTWICNHKTKNKKQKKKK
jgi:hypothetical protein